MVFGGMSSTMETSRKMSRMSLSGPAGARKLTAIAERPLTARSAVVDAAAAAAATYDGRIEPRVSVDAASGAGAAGTAALLLEPLAANYDPDQQQQSCRDVGPTTNTFSLHATNYKHWNRYSFILHFMQTNWFLEYYHCNVVLDSYYPMHH